MDVEKNDVWLCRECDFVSQTKALCLGEKAFCPICKNKISSRSRYPLQVPLAFAITGLILFLPSCFLPLIHMQMLGVTTSHSIFSGIEDFIHQDMWIPAILVFLGAMISPFICLSLSTIILFCLLFNINHQLLPKMLWLFTRIKNWGMLEVYLLGIFISIIKLDDVATVFPAFGLIILTALIFCQIAMILSINTQTLWEAIESLQLKSKSMKHDCL